ncbi:hypothetical protein [Symbiobacterium thermophilum]|jgi:hypothetical protein|uniref:Uncharacterized protein n=2 Tax=Symbiobacterium thermophilum TaxID=2734 RepID=Q67PC0_SYMTH|nr:hypothetical protein [Symbiobacterium thermophilum]MBY6275436.1 hypothetical protein [Symbiobacterium thermophilum]BAD40473.1 conserved hypothetical protein [Symbiobacterium thermophilum IAM 14863]
MAVRPIDSLTMLPRLQEAGRAVQQTEQYPHAFQQVLGAQVQQEGERSQKQVRRRTEAEQPTVTPDGRRPGGQGQPSGRGEHHRRRQARPEPGDAPGGTGRLDVKV